MEANLISQLPPSAYYIPSFLTPTEETHILATLSRIPTNKWTTLSHRRLISLPSSLIGSLNDTLLLAPLPDYLTQPILSRFTTLKIFADSPHQAPNHVLVNEYLPGQGIMPHTDGPAYHPITATVTLGSHTVLDIYTKHLPTATAIATATASNNNNGTQRDTHPKWRILQEPRSLLVTTGELYTDTLHGIAEVQVDEELGPETIVNWELLGDKDRYEHDDDEDEDDDEAEQKRAIQRKSKSKSKSKSKREKRVSLTYRDVRKVAKVGGALKFLAKR